MKTKFKSQRKGAVLATVTVVSVMMVVIIMSATQLVSHTNSKTNEVYRDKQAYYVAASCIRAFVAQTTGMSHDAGNTDEEITEQIRQLQQLATQDEVEVKITSDSHGGSKVGDSQPRWNNAKCTLKVEALTSDINAPLKVISTATYLGRTKTVVAYLNVATLRNHKFTPKALEIIGTDGGIDTKFENLQVYGATGATSMESHDMNTVYKFNHNENKLYGDTDINGSMGVQNNNRFYSNPYFFEGVDDTMGCVLNVSRSMVFVANTPTFDPRFGKQLDNMELNPNVSGSDYNFLNVRQALIFCSNNAKIGTNDENSVDVHAGLLYFGNKDNIGSALETACARKNQTDTTVDVNEYWENIRAGFSFGDGNGNTIHGHVFTHGRDAANIEEATGDTMFNGDMVIANVKVNVTGDVYVDGDLYMWGSDAKLTTNTVHMKNGRHVYNCPRQYDANGNVITPPTSAIVTTLNGVGEIKWDDWSVPRGKRPQFPLLSETPYYYFPEHLLCLDGVSTIKGKYEAMYKPGTDELNVDTANPYHADSDHVPQITDDRFRNKNSDGTYKKVYGDPSGEGPVFRPDYVVTESCYINVLGEDSRGDASGAYIVIDVDEAQDDIVVVLKNGGHTRNNNVILVNNSTDPEVPGEAKFVYFVSDSGVGTTYNEYATSGEISTYDHSTFIDKPKFSFTGATNIVMDLKTYFNSNVYTDVNNGDPSKTRAKCSGEPLNPTPDPANTTPNGIQLRSNNIFFLFTEGSELFCDEANTILQACVYMPRATYRTSNKGRNIKISPDFVTNDMESVAIIGNLVCNHYEVEKGNRNAIVYLGFSPCSMLSVIKGHGDEHATTSYELDHYAAS
jgi:hypothetical protein